MDTRERPETELLLREICSGNPHALNELLASNRDFLLSAIQRFLDVRLHARVDASDVVQETQMEICRRLQDYIERRPMPFRLWLWKTAYEKTLAFKRQHVLASRRSVRREVPLPGRSALMLTQAFRSNATASKQFARGEQAQRVREALGRLSDSDRELLIMRAVDGLSNQEIGAIISLDPASVSKRHGRALMRLHRQLADQGVTEIRP